MKNFPFPTRCCKVCAKVEGEACGGPGGFSGSCEPPLKCIIKPPIVGTGVCMGKFSKSSSMKELFMRSLSVEYNNNRAL